MLVYFIQFVFFSFVGWIIDTTYTSIESRKIIISGYFRGAPLCPIYGFGGILLISIFESLSNSPFWMVILASTLMIVGLEHLGGYFAEHFLGEKLWDYSGEFLSINSYVSGLHSFLWLILVSILYKFWGMKLVIIVRNLEEKFTMTDSVNVFLIFVFIVVGLYITSRTKRFRLQNKSKLSAWRDTIVKYGKKKKIKNPFGKIVFHKK
jgi:uncharacterized membrane protein